MSIVSLQYPVEINGQVINELTLRRPKVRDRLVAEKMSGSEAEREVRLISNLCDSSPDVIEALDMADYAKLQTVLADFLS